MYRTTSSKIVFGLLAGLFILFFLLSYYSEGTFDGGDGILHYHFARYAWAHPYLFLDNWAKPFFTLVASPFAQFGLMGMNVFNILCGLLSAYLCFRIAVFFNAQYPILVIICLSFSAIYFPTLNSGLTEPFFGLVLTFSLFLFVKEYFILSFVVISFLPFVRSEGYLVLMLIAFALIINRTPIEIIYLTVGTIIYSIIGGRHFHDYLWLIHKNPYNGSGQDVYGHGSIWHFVSEYNHIWGATLALLFVVGTVRILSMVKDNINNSEGTVKVPSNELIANLIIYFGSFFIYFIAHSFFWSGGIVGSLGLIRVMAAVMPISAILCVFGIQDLLAFAFLNERSRNIIITIILILIIITPFTQNYFPYKQDGEQQLVSQAAAWYNTSPYKQKDIYFAHPYLVHKINVDRFDTAHIHDLGCLFQTAPSKSIKDSAIIFWDGHFGPNESRMPLQKLMNDSNYCLLKSFVPNTEIKGLNDSPFAIYVFARLHTPATTKVKLDSMGYDFELPASSISGSQSFEAREEGNKFLRLLPSDEYGPTISLAPLVLKNAYDIRHLQVEVDVKNNSTLEVEPKLVVSVVRSDGTTAYWQKIDFPKVKKDVAWQRFSQGLDFSPAQFNATDVVLIYFWNTRKNSFSIDNFRLNFFGQRP
ncbi:MAG: hypothetical protein WCP52_09945 [Bacteroidota bacterium]